MKCKDLLFILLLLIGINLNAQHGRTDVKGGLGLANVSLAEASIPVMYAEFTKVFIEPMIIAMYIDAGVGRNLTIDSLQRNITSATFDLGFYYGIINDKKSKFEIGLSFSGHFFNFEDHPMADPLEPDGALEPGFGGSMNYSRIFKKNWMAGLKLSYHYYNNVDKVYLLGLHVGYKF